jgi:hypothetical protein
MSKTYAIDYDGWIVNRERMATDYSPMANPITTIIDAYNGYATCYNECDSNNTSYTIFENTDNDIFEGRLQPKGSMTLFRTRNPITGEVNVMPFSITTRAGHNSGFPMALHNSYNPYTGAYKEVKFEVLV